MLNYMSKLNLNLNMSKIKLEFKIELKPFMKNTIRIRINRKVFQDICLLLSNQRKEMSYRKYLKKIILSGNQFPHKISKLGSLILKIHRSDKMT